LIYDVVVVGGGILGLATAREWQQRFPGESIAVLEREPQLAAHQTGHNSGVVHAGIYYAPGSLKAQLCAEGRDKLYAFCDEHGVAYEKTGKLIVAVDPSELERLEELERRGRANGVPGLRRVGAQELRELEPHATGIAALHSPETGIVDFAAVARKLAGLLERDGAEVVTGAEVIAFARQGERAYVTLPGGTIETRRVIACAGTASDHLAVLDGGAPDPRIIPFRGAYLKLRAERRELVRGLIYPVPDPALPFLGVHLTRHIDGDVLLGPTALLHWSRRSLAWPGTWRVMSQWWRTGARELAMAASRRAFVRACARYVPELTVADVERGTALTGVRAQAVGRDGALVDDFVFSDGGAALHVRNAPSPGATSALAIGRLIVDRATVPGRRTGFSSPAAPARSARRSCAGCCATPTTRFASPTNGPRRRGCARAARCTPAICATSTRHAPRRRAARTSSTWRRSSAGSPTSTSSPTR
jgi:2-hydroxyglutarate dehydrogenase